MAGLADLNVRLGLLTANFERDLKKADRRLRAFQKSVEGIGKGLTQGLTLPIIGFGSAAVSSFAQFEKGAKALEVVTKDAKSVGDQLEELREVAKLPGLGFQEAVQGSARLQAVGLSADEAAKTLGAFGNAVARSGGGRVELEGALLALTQIASKGKISAEEINQLNERIFEIRPALEAAFGTSNSEELQKLGISSEEFISKVTEELGKLDKVQGGLSNSFENLGDSIRSNLSRVGEIINNTFNIGDIIDRFDRSLTSIVDTFQALDPATQKTVVRVAAFAAALGPGLLVIGKLIALRRGLIDTLLLASQSFRSLGGSAINAANNIKNLNFKAFLTPQLLAVSAAIGLVALAWSEFSRKAQLATAAQRTIEGVTNSAAAALAVETAKIDPLISAIKSETVSREEKAKAIQQLKEISPEYFGQLDEERIRVADVTAAYDNFKKSVLLTAQARAAESKLTEIASKRFEKEQKLLKLQDQFVKQSASVGTALIQGILGNTQRGAIAFGRLKDELESVKKEEEALVKLLGESTQGLNKLGAESESSSAKTVTSFERISESAKKIPEEISRINKELSAITQKSIALGPSFDTEGASLDTLTTGVERLLELGAGTDNSAIKGFIDQIKELRGSVVEVQEITSKNLIPAEVVSQSQESLSLVGESYKKLAAQIFEQTEGSYNFIQRQIEQAQILANVVGSVLDSAFSSLFQTIEEGGKNAFGSFLDGIKKAISGLIKQLLVAVAKALVLAAIFSLIVPGASFASKFGSLFKSFSGIPGLAEGGVVPSGYPNDTYPARLTSGEVVVPPDKLSTLMNSGSGQQVFIPSVTLRGEDLVIAFKRAEKKYNRYS